MRRRPSIQPVFAILIGTFIMAFSYYHINFQNNLAEGSFVGLALLGKYAFDISPAFTMLLLDIPILAIALFVKGRKFIFFTAIGATSLSLFYEIFEVFSPLVFDFQNNMLFAAILSGMLTGFGAGLVLRFGGATGGDDILSLFISDLTGISVGTVLFLFDVIVLGLSLIYLPLADVLYTILAVAVAGKMITWTVEYSTDETLAIPYSVQH